MAPSLGLLHSSERRSALAYTFRTIGMIDTITNMKNVSFGVEPKVALVH